MQDRNLNIEIEPVMQLSFYSSPSELRRNNIICVRSTISTALRIPLLVVTNHVPTIDEESAARHFQSIEYYNSYLCHASAPARRLGRALDFLTVRDYQNAEKDADRSHSCRCFRPRAGVWVRAQARYGRYMLDSDGEGDARMRQAMARKLLGDIADDYRRVLELSPNTPVAWYNLGNILSKARTSTAPPMLIPRQWNQTRLRRGLLQLWLYRPPSAADVATTALPTPSKAGELVSCRHTTLSNAYPNNYGKRKKALTIVVVLPAALGVAAGIFAKHYLHGNPWRRRAREGQHPRRNFRCQRPRHPQLIARQLGSKVYTLRTCRRATLRWHTVLAKSSPVPRHFA